MSAKTDEFIKEYSNIAINEAVRTGIPASITMAQAILESGWGGSGLSVAANNFFGIKADESWKGPVYNGATHEEYDEKVVYLDDDFRKYNHPRESFRDHSKFLEDNQRYDFLFQYPVDDYKSWAHGLESAGYATSSQYEEKIDYLIDEYDLNELDQKAKLRRMLYSIALILAIGITISIVIKILKSI